MQVKDWVYVVVLVVGFPMLLWGSIRAWKREGRSESEEFKKLKGDLLEAQKAIVDLKNDVAEIEDLKTKVSRLESQIFEIMRDIVKLLS